MTSIRSLLVMTLCLVAWGAQAGTVSRELQQRIATHGTHADTSVIVRFGGGLDAQSLAVGDRRARDNRLMLALQAQTAQHRAAIEPMLASVDATRIKTLWIIDGIAVTVPAVAVRQLAARDDVESIDLDAFVQGGRPQRMPAPRARPFGTISAEPAAADQGGAAMSSPAWNVAAVHAPELWARGHTASHVVVATMDTGADLSHPDLGRSWHGGAGGWFDPHGEESTPYDQLGHGTQALGVIVGRRGTGVAPDARWIATRLYDSNGRASMSDIHRAFQWLMDPDGNPSTADAPDVVNASWALSGRAAGGCIREFERDLRVLRSAGIVVVFAAGNDGPAPGTSSSPGNNPGGLSVGAVDRQLKLARATSRGPSSCDGAAFPRLVAPGVDVRTTDLAHGASWSFTTVSGSSLAAPHVAGVFALLAGAFPAASVRELEDAVLGSAHDLGEAGRLVDALAAFEMLRSSQPSH